MVDRRLWFRHRCLVCKLLFVSERDLLLHEATHEKPEFSCTSCSEIFETEDQYKCHRNVGCERNGKAQVCAECGAVFEQLRDLYDHHSAMHLHEKKYRCKVCRATFSWPENLERHEQIHQNKSSMCKTCGAIFGSMASLKVHLWKAHSVNIRDQDEHMLEVSLPCQSNKNKSIGTSGQLRYGGQTSSSEGTAARQPEEKPYKCPLCNWAFKYDFSFNLHLKMHKEKHKVNNDTAETTENTAAAKKDIYLQVLNKTPSVKELYKEAVNVTGKAKKTVYIQKADILYNFSSSKPQVIVAGKNQEQTSTPKTVASSQEKVTQDATPASSGICGRTSENSGSKVSEKSQNCMSNGSHPFTCKTCMVTFQYDFSYMAHMQYHEKVKEMDFKNTEIQINTQPHYRNAIMSNSQMSGSEILINGSCAIVQPDGTVLIKMDDLVPHNLMDSSALKMYNFPDGKTQATHPNSADHSNMKYFLIQSSKPLSVPDIGAVPDNSCIVEEVVNVDEQNSSVLGVAFMPDEYKGCLSDEYSKDSSDVAQVIVVENQESGKYLLSTDVQMTSGSLELDKIEVDDERIANEIPEGVETIEEAYYGVLVGDKPDHNTYNSHIGLDGSQKDKPHTCSVCQAEFRWKTSLQAHMRKHLKDPSKVLSNLQALKVGRTIYRHT